MDRVLSGGNPVDPSLLSVQEALERILRSVDPLPDEPVALGEALGRVLSQDVLAATDVPPFANSAMDGYAVMAKDVATASKERPARLSVVGDIPAGVGELPELPSGSAMRIMTGAVLPPGADAVVPVEKTSSRGAMAGQDLQRDIHVFAAVRSGDHIRQAGQDVRSGQVILPAGRRLRPQEVGMLASQGYAQIRVHRRAKVAILSTGDELLEIQAPLVTGKIRDSNSYTLAAAVESSGAEARRLGITPDDEGAVAERLDEAVRLDADLLISSAGVSMGAFDYVRSVVESRGELVFWRVNVRPGKPLVFGRYRDTPFLGLPGNPVSALVTFQLFVKPAIDRLHGMEQTAPLLLRARLDHSAESDGRESYLRAVVRREGAEYRVRLTRSQDSGVLSSLVAANSLVIVPAGIRFVPEGDFVDTWVLDPIQIPLQDPSASKPEIDRG